MCTNPTFCEGDCEQCDLPRSYMSSLIGTDGKPLFRFKRPNQRKVVSAEEQNRLNKFMEEQLKIVSEMGRKFYKARENINEFERQNRKII